MANFNASGLNRPVQPGRIGLSGTTLPARPGIPNVQGLFQQQQPNLFDQINTAIQLRRKNEREAMEDEMARKQFELQEKKLEKENRKLDIELQAEERKSGQPSFLDQLKSIGGTSGLSPGTMLSFKDPISGATISTPLVREFTESESQVIAGAGKYTDTVDRLKKQVEKGVFGKGKKRTINQLLAQSGDSSIARLMVEDNSDLEKVQSDILDLKKIAFTEGGKALTESEQAIVFPAFEFVGKSDEAIIRDLEKAIEIMASKGLLIKEGGGAVNKLKKRPEIASTSKKQSNFVGNVGKYKIRSVRDA